MFFNKKKKEKIKQIDVSYDTYVPIEEPTGIPIGNISNEEPISDEVKPVPQIEIIFDEPKMEENRSLNDIIGITNTNVSNDIGLIKPEASIENKYQFMQNDEKNNDNYFDDEVEKSNITTNKKFFDNNDVDFKLEKKANNDKFTIGTTNIFSINKISTNENINEKVCPICTKKVSADANICLICGHKF